MSDGEETIDNLFNAYTDGDAERGLNQSECYNLLSEFQKYPTSIDIKTFWKDKSLGKDDNIGLTELKELSDKLGDGSVRLADALAVFDTNGDGYIDMDELQTLLVENASVLDFDSPDADWQAHILKKADKNNDGKIDLEELKVMLQQKTLVVAHHDVKIVGE